MPEGSKNGEMLPEAQMGGALPATSRHTRRLPGCFLPDLTVNRVALRENQQSPIVSVVTQRAGALSLC